MIYLVKMVNIVLALRKSTNNRIQLTVKSVTFFAKQKNAPLFTASDAGVIAFCEGMKRKRKLLRKEQKLSAVKLVSAGENEARMWST